MTYDHSVNQQKQSPIGRIIPRRVHGTIEEAMQYSRVVLINGARQCGKSTIAAEVGAAHGAEWRSLDDPRHRRAAAEDPTSFVTSERPLVIDEVQRVPDLILPIKAAVDLQYWPGQFLLTGSARVFDLRVVPDSLVGRVQTIELWPLSQGEIDEGPDGFVEAAFKYGPDLRHTTAETRNGYIDRIVRGGFPDAVARPEKRRPDFFRSYVSDIVNRDIVQLSEIERGPQMRKLVQLLAARNGQLVVPGNLASELDLTRPTVSSYITLLEEVFLIKKIPAWSRSIGKRAVATPKFAFTDSGIAANLMRSNAHTLKQVGSPLGGLVEGFVAMEIARQLTWADDVIDMSHYRTKDNVEVDIVLENSIGQVIGIEVKAGATPRSEDFNGLRHLQQRVGDDFVAGFVLDMGKDTMPFGPKLRAMPIAALWETPQPE